MVSSQLLPFFFCDFTATDAGAVARPPSDVMAATAAAAMFHVLQMGPPLPNGARTARLTHLLPRWGLWPVCRSGVGTARPWEGTPVDPSGRTDPGRRTEGGLLGGRCAGNLRRERGGGARPRRLQRLQCRPRQMPFRLPLPVLCPPPSRAAHACPPSAGSPAATAAAGRAFLPRRYRRHRRHRRRRCRSSTPANACHPLAPARALACEREKWEEATKPTVALPPAPRGTHQSTLLPHGGGASDSKPSPPPSAALRRRPRARSPKQQHLSRLPAGCAAPPSSAS